MTGADGQNEPRTPARGAPARRRPVGARACGYRVCTDLLPEYHGKGRPDAYHKDARWRLTTAGTWVADPVAGERNCKQMADAERRATRDAGIPTLVNLLEERTASLAGELAPAIDTLQELNNVLNDLRGGLSAAVVTAEQARMEAERDRDHAEDRTRSAEQSRRDAETQETAATQRARDAETLAKTLTAEAEQRATDAHERAGLLERERGAATAAAAAAQGRAAAAEQDRDTAEQHNRTLTAQVVTLTERITGLERDLGEQRLRTFTAEQAGSDTQGTLDAVRAQAAQDAAAAADQLGELARERDVLRAAVNDLGPRAIRAEQQAREATDQAKQVQAELAAAAAAAQQSESQWRTQLEDERSRLQDLLTALARGGFTATDSPGIGPGPR